MLARKTNTDDGQTIEVTGYQTGSSTVFLDIVDAEGWITCARITAGQVEEIKAALDAAVAHASREETKDGNES